MENLLEKQNKQLDELSNAMRTLTSRIEKSERRGRLYSSFFAVIALVILLGGIASAQLPNQSTQQPQGHPAAAQNQQPGMSEEDLKKAMMAMMQTAVTSSMELVKQQDPGVPLTGSQIQALVDTSQLLAIYSMIGNTDGIEALMQEANVALKAVPHMVIEMQKMNYSIGMMNYNIAETMGKMGSWMPLPWGPE